MVRSAFISIATLQAILPFAAALSLSNFQPIPDDIEVPFTCAIAYRQSISGCDSSDFLDGAACSSKCVKGLSIISLGVNTNCPGVIADSNSLLGKIFQGQLISILCPNTFETTSAAASSQTTDPSVSETTTQRTPTTLAAKTSTSSTSTTTSSATPTTATSSFSSVSTKVTKSSAASSSSGTTLTSSSVEVISSASAPTSSDSTTIQAKSTSTASQTTPSPKSGGGSAQSQQAAAMAGSGGGSPFDIQLADATSSADRTSTLSTLRLLTILCLLNMGILLGR